MNSVVLCDLCGLRVLCGLRGSPWLNLHDELIFHWHLTEEINFTFLFFETKRNCQDDCVW